ncbi:hypothetical protein IHE45_01G049700 [Dioscorea alata]|uniref:Uncharacterized protein n=1 Tax=Dioscorea alata TaxID=55571 RepID=A0ACB7WUY6_DIOAL|nr:hypothetical protein IHE45_01G049700 [Dioscorea alata]
MEDVSSFIYISVLWKSWVTVNRVTVEFLFVRLSLMVHESKSSVGAWREVELQCVCVRVCVGFKFQLGYMQENRSNDVMVEVELQKTQVIALVEVELQCGKGSHMMA